VCGQALSCSYTMLSDIIPLHWLRNAGFSSTHCSEHCSLFNQSLDLVPKIVSISFPVVECALNFFSVGE
jgi:hypothetical protein